MQRITITAGIGEDRNGNAMSDESVAEMLATIRARLAATFGGYTETDAMGGWINESGRLVVEPSKRWILLTDANAKDADELADAAARVIGRGLRQAAVVIERETIAGRFVDIAPRALEIG